MAELKPPISPDRPLPPWARSRKIFGQLVFASLLVLAAGLGALVGMAFVYSSDLPKMVELENYRPDVMTELYDDAGTPIASFALEHRVIVTYNQIPPVVRDAVISIEDRHFFSHSGVDLIRIVRAAITDLLQRRIAQGASTLTQQLSRMFFLTPEQSFRRKFQEMLLAIQIERHFTKEQIFTMYANQVGLGAGNYGFEAAAQFFFGKHLNQLTLPEAALLAGLPKTPTGYSPLLHPDRALRRRNLVLEAMYDNDTISGQQYMQAKDAPLGLNVQRWNNSIAPYFVEDVREFLDKKYGSEAVQEKGLRVYTTLNLKLQQEAVKALRQGIRDDDKRRGWRGPEKNILKTPVMAANGIPASLETYRDEDWRKPLQPDELVHGLVMEVKPDYAVVRFGNLTARVTPHDFAWTKKASAEDVFLPGDVELFQVKETRGRIVHVTLEQYPEVQGALVAVDNKTGAIKAMVGGYDYEQSKFNRAVQAERQVGSSFKVYVYTQAFLDGMNPFETIVDSPISFPSATGVWAPHNYDDKYEGSISLIRALAESRNVPAVRLLARVGVDRVIKLCRKFGIASRLVPNLPLALGASDLTLLEHTSAFTTFPDDGLHITPRMVVRVADYDGRLIDDFPPQITDVIPAPTARLMVSMLREPIEYPTGTAVHARALAGKYPLAGKTGTTNDFTDAWFIGFSPSITCGVWVGFDDHHSLQEPAGSPSVVGGGYKEEGSHVALPIWMVFMSEALGGKPVENFPYSPVLTSPDQVKEILASTGTEALLTERATAPSGNPVAAPPTAKVAAGATAQTDQEADGSKLDGRAQKLSEGLKQPQTKPETGSLSAAGTPSPSGQKTDDTKQPTGGEAGRAQDRATRYPRGATMPTSGMPAIGASPAAPKSQSASSQPAAKPVPTPETGSPQP